MAIAREAEPVGSLNEVREAGLDRDDLLGIYRNMVLTRGIEERGHILYKQGKIPGSFYTGRGNEAAAVGVATAMGPDDVGTPLHRDLGVHIVRGLEPWRIFAQYMGRVDGPTKGRDGNVHIADTRLGMIMLYAAFNLPLVIWMMRSFFADLPKEILEAATVDGAGFLKIMTKVVLPLSAPGLAATALLSVIFSWNEFLLAVNLTGANTGTLPVFISGFMTSEGLFWAKMSAASTLAVAPVILAGWLAQRSLVRGLTFGAVK